MGFQPPISRGRYSDMIPETGNPGKRKVSTPYKSGTVFRRTEEFCDSMESFIEVSTPYKSGTVFRQEVPTRLALPPVGVSTPYKSGTVFRRSDPGRASGGLSVSTPYKSGTVFRRDGTIMVQANSNKFQPPISRGRYSDGTSPDPSPS